MIARLVVTLKKTEQNRIIRTDKSEAAVTNNKKLCRDIVLFKLTTQRHEASRRLFATADELLVHLCKADTLHFHFLGECSKLGRVTTMRKYY